MNTPKKIAVLGGTGFVGSALVKELLAADYEIKLLVRNPEKITHLPGNIELVAGNALDSESIDNLLRDCSAVISTIGQRRGEPLVFVNTTQNVLSSMEKYGIKRYIVLAGLGIDAPTDKKSFKIKLATGFMRMIAGKMVGEKQKEYELLAKSSIDWTLVRVPLIIEKPQGGDLKISTETCRSMKINVNDLADFLLTQINDRRFVGKAPFVSG